MGAPQPGTVVGARRKRRSACAQEESTEGEGSAALRSLAPVRATRERLDTLIVQQWTKSLRGPFDWGDWPLARYAIGAGVLESGELGTAPAARRLAWACAMVACGRAPRLRSLDPRPLPGPDGGQLRRADGAHGWCCHLRRGRGAGPRLRYWIHPCGLVEFETVVNGEEPCRE